MIPQNIHEEIDRLTDKIKYLNQNLKSSGIIHSVEVDLLKAYTNELAKLLDQLLTSEEKRSTNEEDQVKEEPAIVKDEVEPVETKTTEPKETEAIQWEPEESAEVEVEENNLETTPAAEEVVEEIVEPVAQQVTEPELEEESEVETPEAELIVKVGQHEVEEEKELSLHERFRKDEAEVNTKLKAGAKDLRKMIDLSEKFIYARELFEGDVDTFDLYLRKLNTCDSFNNAEQLISAEIQPRYNWEGKEQMISKFKSLIEQRFAN